MVRPGIWDSRSNGNGERNNQPHTHTHAAIVARANANARRVASLRVAIKSAHTFAAGSDVLFCIGTLDANSLRALARVPADAVASGTAAQRSYDNKLNTIKMRVFRIVIAGMQARTICCVSICLLVYMRIQCRTRGNTNTHTHSCA